MVILRNLLNSPASIKEIQTKWWVIGCLVRFWILNFTTLKFVIKVVFSKNMFCFVGQNNLMLLLLVNRCKLSSFIGYRCLHRIGFRDKTLVDVMLTRPSQWVFLVFCVACTFALPIYIPIGHLLPLQITICNPSYNWSLSLFFFQYLWWDPSFDVTLIAIYKSIFPIVICSSRILKSLHLICIMVHYLQCINSPR